MGLSLKKYLKDFVTTQSVSNRAVLPEHRWNGEKKSFYLNSEAGLLIYKPKTLQELVSFRNRFINKFSQIAEFPPKARRKYLFKFYREVRASTKVRYRANIRTRMESKLWDLYFKVR